MHVTHLTYETSQLSLAYLECMLRTLVLVCSRQNGLTQTVFYDKVMTVSRNFLNTILKVKNRRVGWVLQVRLSLNECHFHAIGKSRDCKLDHGRSGTTCILCRGQGVDRKQAPPHLQRTLGFMEKEPAHRHQGRCVA